MVSIFTQKTKYLLSLSGMYALTGVIALSTFRGVIPNQFSSEVNAQAITLPTALTRTSSDGPVIVKGKPVRIVIESIGMDFNLLEGSYSPIDKSWTLSNDRPHFAMPTAPANDTIGNTFIYGHNNPSVFGPLNRIQSGSEIKIFTDNNKVFSYILRSITDFDPTDVGIFSYSGPPILTLQTCSGAWNEKRRMFTFNFEGVS